MISGAWSALSRGLGKVLSVGPSYTGENRPLGKTGVRPGHGRVRRRLDTLGAGAAEVIDSWSSWVADKTSSAREETGELACEWAWLQTVVCKRNHVQSFDGWELACGEGSLCMGNENES